MSKDTMDRFDFESTLRSARECYRIAHKSNQKPMKRYALKRLADSVVFLDRMSR